MDSAPKDGTWIWAHRPSKDVGFLDRVLVIRWDNNVGAWVWPDEGRAMSAREMTSKELAWWRELKRLMRNLPKNVELNARTGEIGISPAGSRETSFNKHGHADRFSEDEWEAVPVPRVDGRDSQL